MMPQNLDPIPRARPNLTVTTSERDEDLDQIRTCGQRAGHTVTLCGGPAIFSLTTRKFRHRKKIKSKGLTILERNKKNHIAQIPQQSLQCKK